MKNKILYILLGSTLVLFVSSNTTIADSLKTRAIKPTGSTAVTDEQQGILAVRTAKVSVVNIIGSIGKEQKIDSVYGTGYIVESNGYIISNSHVVSDKNASYRVQLFTGQEFPAKVIGVDTYFDIAVLKIEATSLGTVKLGNSDALETGQSVFAIGNSLGKYQNTVTRGVVSGLGRNVSVGTRENPAPRLQNLIQTDASINPGNSGGPLVNMAGEVVGMNTLIDTEGQGLGFAIPINVIKDVYNQLKTLGKAPHPYLGIGFSTIDKNLKFAEKLSVDQGALVSQVESNGPAGKGGLKVGDIILSINGETLSTSNELDVLLQRKYQAGNQILMKVLRGDQRLDITVILGEYK